LRLAVAHVTEYSITKNVGKKVEKMRNRCKTDPR